MSTTYVRRSLQTQDTGDQDNLGPQEDLQLYIYVFLGGMVCVGILSVLLYCHHQRRLQRYVDRDNLNNNMQRHSLVDSFLEEGEHEWQCSICYHENHPAKPECLMCGTTQVVSQQALASPHKPKEAATMTSSSHNNNNAIEESRHFLQAARQRSFHVRRLNQMNLNQRQRGARRRNLWKRGKGVDGQLRWFRTDQDSTSRVSILTTTPSLRQSTLSDSDESLPNVERRTATTLATESSSAIVVGNPELEDSVEEPQSSLSSSSSTYFHLTPGALAPSTPASPRHRQHAIQFNLMPSTETQLAMSPTGVAMKTKTTAIGGGGGAPPPPPSSCTTFDIPAVADDDSKKDDFESSNDDPLASSSSSSSTRRCDPQGHQLLSQKSIGYVRHVEDDGSVVWVPAHTVDIGDPVSSLDPVEYPRASAVIDFEAIAALPFRHKVRWLLQELDRVSVPWEDGHLLLKIRRDAVLQESLHLLMLVPACDIRQRLRIEFIDEPGLDAGGLMREWVLLLCEQLFDESFGLFQTTHVENLSYWINARSHQMMTKFPTMDHLKCFEFIGRLVAKCLLEGQLLTVHFALPLLKHILGVPISLSDLEFIDETFYKNLCWIRTQDGISNLCLDFTVEHEDARGRRTVVELKPGGASVPVTDENKEEYLNLMLQNKMFTSVSDQISALLKGLYDVIPQTLLAAFDYQELELLLCGVPEIDVDDWKRHSDQKFQEFDQPTKAEKKVVQWFWEVVTNFSQEQRARLLQFVTGTSRVPVEGFKALTSNDGRVRRFGVQIVSRGIPPAGLYPKAHTCFNRIDIPAYASKSELETYLTLVINMEITGFTMQ